MEHEYLIYIDPDNKKIESTRMYKFVTVNSEGHMTHYVIVNDKEVKEPNFWFLKLPVYWYFDIQYIYGEPLFRVVNGNNTIELFGPEFENKVDEVLKRLKYMVHVVRGDTTIS